MRFHSLHLPEQVRQKSIVEKEPVETRISEKTLVPLIEEVDEDEVTEYKGKEGSEDEDEGAKD